MLCENEGNITPSGEICNCMLKKDSTQQTVEVLLK